MTINFPDPRLRDEDGIVFIGGDITAANLLASYQKGIFPWPMYPKPYPVLWFSPDPRGVLFLKDFHISKSLKKFLKKDPFQVTMNQCFQKVLSYCQSNKNRRENTWITPELIKGYTDLFEQGNAYSVEVWNHNKQLVGGLYGVKISDYISAESMFFLESNASKTAIVYLANHLSNTQTKWIDIQMVTPITASFGGIEVSQAEFLNLLENAF